jgi:hypothetical protein
MSHTRPISMTMIEQKRQRFLVQFRIASTAQEEEEGQKLFNQLIIELDTDFLRTTICLCCAKCCYPELNLSPIEAARKEN